VADDGTRAKYVISGSYDGSVRVWNVKTGQCIKHLPGHDGGVEFTQVIQSEFPILVAASRYRKIRVWSLETGKEVHTFEGLHGIGEIYSFLALKDGVIVSPDDGSITIWKLPVLPVSPRLM
jgi:WD40 repeat protein